MGGESDDDDDFTDNDGFDTTGNTDRDGFDTTNNTDRDGFDTTGNNQSVSVTDTDSDNFSS